MHRQNSTIECTIRRLGLHGGDVVVHGIPIIQRPCGSRRHWSNFTALFGRRTRPVFLNMSGKLVPLAKRMEASHPAGRDIRVPWVFLFPAFVCPEGFLPPPESFVPLVVLCDIVLFARDEERTPR